MRRRIGHGSRALATTVAFAVLGAGGCGLRPGLPGRGAGGSGPRTAADLITAKDRARLEALAATRAGARGARGYRIGPDDLLEIRIPDLLEAQASAVARGAGGVDVPVVSGAPTFLQGVRVSASGEVNVPMLGLVRAGGLTPRQLEVEIARRLVAAGILRTPHVSVQVAEHRSRVVAVIGAVERPGLYPLTKPSATLADLLWAAGGPNREAGRVVEFVPAPEGEDERCAIRLDLEALLGVDGEPKRLVNLPALPGDVLNLSPAGSVLVDGWVEKPGSYPVTRGLTVSGAVAAAGGSTFPARRQATIKRVLAGGGEESFTVDLDAVGHGLAPDVPVTDGDVVRLPPSAGRLVPWGLWILAKTMVHVGGSVPLF